MNYMLAFTGAILDSRRDGVLVHASHFSRPPSLLEAEGGLYSCSGLEDGQDESYRPALRWGAAYALVSFSLRRLRSVRARGFRLGRSLRTRRNFPVVWYKTKKKSHSFITHVLTCFLVLFTFDAPVEPVHSIRWVGGSECAR